jgi:hypothetical protein
MSPNRSGNLAVIAPPNSSTAFQAVSTGAVTVIVQEALQRPASPLLLLLGCFCFCW